MEEADLTAAAVAAEIRADLKQKALAKLQRRLISASVTAGPPSSPVHGPVTAEEVNFHADRLLAEARASGGDGDTIGQSPLIPSMLGVLPVWPEPRPLIMFGGKSKPVIKPHARTFSSISTGAHNPYPVPACDCYCTACWLHIHEWRRHCEIAETKRRGKLLVSGLTQQLVFPETKFANVKPSSTLSVPISTPIKNEQHSPVLSLRSAPPSPPAPYLPDPVPPMAPQKKIRTKSPAPDGKMSSFSSDPTEQVKVTLRSSSPGTWVKRQYIKSRGRRRIKTAAGSETTKDNSS